MRVRQLLLINLLALPLLACGNKQPEPGPEPEPTIDYTVTEAEFKHALSWEGKEYIQGNGQMESEYTGKGKSLIMFSPGAYSMGTVNETEAESFEERAFTDDEINYRGYTNTDDKGWVAIEPSEAKEFFKTPEDINLFAQLTKMGKKYSDFKFDEDLKCYCTRIKHDEYHVDDMYLCFKDKEFVYFFVVSYGYDEESSKWVAFSGEDSTFTYEQQEIVEPKVDY